MKRLLFVVAALLLWAGVGQANDTVIRISCRPQDQGANIYVNGSFKGECSADGSVDVFIPSGVTIIKARKMPDPQHEQVFSKKFMAVAGVAKRIKVALSAPKLTADARLAKAKAAFAAQLKAANGGDLQAMAKVADLYEAGSGVAMDRAKARSWRNKIEKIKASKELKAAESGDLTAMAQVVTRYQRGKGLPQDSKKASQWQDKLTRLKKEAKKQRQARERRQRAAARKAALERELKQASYVKNFNRAAQDMANQKDPISGLIGATLSPLCLPFDLISSPTRMMERRKIRKRYEAHAGAWANPQSMLARAYHTPVTRTTLSN